MEQKFDPIKAEFMLSSDTDFLPLASAAKAMNNAYRDVGFRPQDALTLTAECIKQMIHDAMTTNKEGRSGE